MGSRRRLDTDASMADIHGAVENPYGTLRITVAWITRGRELISGREAKPRCQEMSETTAPS